MKKFLLCFTCIMTVLVLSGCSFGNTPTKKVENFLDNYKNGDETVIGQLEDMVNSDSLMTDEQKTTYSDIMKRQYQDLTYEIKDETIDGDNATVTAEIEVYDFYKVNQEAQEYYNNNQNEFKAAIKTDEEGIVDEAGDAVENAGEAVSDAASDVAEGAGDIIENTIDDAKYVEYRLERLKEAKDRVKYTIEFTLTKVNDVWNLNDIDDMTRKKIHGLYEH